MKLFSIFVVCFLANTFFAGPIITGNSIIESGKIIPKSITVTEVKSSFERELLQNPGFETGSLYPWFTNNWIIDSTNPHQGRYCASDTGDYWIRQNIGPIPAVLISHVTFWARQPEAPAAQAYHFIYSDSSVESFVHFPTAEWAEYDVTANLNRQKMLAAFRLWGYNGGGPYPDSTYIDDVSITRNLDVFILSVISPMPDTYYLNDTITPSVMLSNFGPFNESLWVWCQIEHTESTYIYRDSTLSIIQAGEIGTVSLNNWTPIYTGQYRFRFELSPNDTTIWDYFWVEGSGIKENTNFLINKTVIVRPTIGTSFEFVCEHKSSIALKIYNALGKLIWTKMISGKEPMTIKWYGKDKFNRNLSPGVYIVRIGEVSKRIILTK